MADLVDCRSKITAEADLMLEAIAKSTGKDKSELVREIVQGWFQSRWEEHEMIKRLFRGKREGAESAGEGKPGNSNAEAYR
jgi:hypothetical protein